MIIQFLSIEELTWRQDKMYNEFNSIWLSGFYDFFKDIDLSEIVWKLQSSSPEEIKRHMYYIKDII